VRLTNDMLDIDRLEQGTIAFQFAPLDLGQIIRSAVGSVTDAFRERRLTLEPAIPEELPTVHGDGERLLQVLANLLDNARKYAPEGSTVTVRATVLGDGVQVDVCDQGPGIPPTEQPLVFRRFWQTDRAGADAGAGLGLAICRAIVERHDGRIWIDSDPEDGTTASFFLSRSLFRADAAEAARAAVGPAPAPGARILLVEDDADARAVMKASLEQSGYVVIEAPSGGQAVRLARRERPDIVLLDLVLPDISGYDVLRILKNSPDTAAVAVVVLSIEPERDLARRLGAFEALQKPIDFEAVRFSIVGALRSVGRGDGRLVLGVGPTLSRDVVVLASSLEAESHEVYRARDLDDLKTWSASHYPDMLVLDSDFIGQSCAEAAAAIQAIAAGRNIPLVFLGSGDVAPPSDGCWVELAKPICKDDVLEAAETLRTTSGA
jgi:DNA-binding response OmpR family regulator